MEIIDYWRNCKDIDLVEDMQRQTWGCKICLEGLMSAAYFESTRNYLKDIRQFITSGHHALNRLCNVAINLQKNYDCPGQIHLRTEQVICMYITDLIDLMEHFKDYAEYFLNYKKIIVIFLRIVYKLRRIIELFLVHINFWLHYMP